MLRAPPAHHRLEAAGGPSAAGEQPHRHLALRARWPSADQAQVLLRHLALPQLRGHRGAPGVGAPHLAGGEFTGAGGEFNGVGGGEFNGVGGDLTRAGGDFTRAQEGH